MDEDDKKAPLVVSVGDSHDARLFIELSSHASDLAEARGALEMSIEAREPDSPLWDAAAYLIGFSVVAYCRCFGLSDVRKPITEHIEIPQDLLRTHEQVRTFRNATIAHSQSDLAVTYPVALLEPTTLELRYVSGTTISTTLPSSVANEFRDLIDALQELLDEAIDPIRARLEAGLRNADRDELLSASRPDVVEKLARDFNPRTKRKLYPDGHTVYWDLDNPDQ